MTLTSTGSVLALGTLFIVLGVTTVGARFIVRSKNGGIGVDDWLYLAALVGHSRSC